MKIRDPLPIMMSTKNSKVTIGDWVLVYFAQDQAGKPGMGHIESSLIAAKIYFPDDPKIQVHQS